MTSDTSTTDQAKQTASTAKDEGKHVAGVAAGEAKGVAAEAGQQVKSVVGDAVGQARGQLDDQSRQQKQKLAGTLSTFSDDLGRMAENGSGMAGDLANEVAERVRSISRQLDQREPAELLDDARRFARQRPGTFLVGALAAGLVVGRLVRGTKDAVEAAEANQGGQGYGGQGGPRVTPGASNTTDVYATHGQTTQPSTSAVPPPVVPTTSPSSTGYSSPPAGTGLGGTTSGPTGGSGV